MLLSTINSTDERVKAVVVTDFDNHERSRWAGRAAAYQRSFAKLCAYPAAALLDAAGVRAGVCVLDVGTGTGTIAAMACARGATVVAVDAEPTMLELARRNAPRADVRHAVLPDLPFPDGEFDVAVANFVINHVGDPLATVMELRRVVRYGGRVAVTIWPYPQPPLQRLWGEVFDAAGAQPPATMPTVAADKNFERSADGLARLLSEARMTDVACETINWQHRADPEDWWIGPANGIGTLGLLLESQPPDTVARIKKQYDRLTTAYLANDGLLALPTAALLASARAE